MKNNIKKWLVSVALMAILINVFSGVNLSVNANEVEETSTAAVTESTKKETNEDINSSPTQVLEEPDTDTEPEPDSDSDIDTSWTNTNPSGGDGKGRVEVTYVSDNTYLDSKQIVGEVGDKYTIEVLEFDGYRYTGNAALEGVIKEETTYVTLQYISETIEIEAYVNLQDNKDAAGIRPKEATVTLLRDGEEIDNAVLDISDPNSWSTYHDFGQGFPVYNSNGDKYEYSFKISNFPKEYHIEEDVSGYSGRLIYTASAGIMDGDWEAVIYKNFMIDETSEPEDLPPVTFHLLKNGVDIEGSPFTLSQDSGWDAYFAGLPRLDEDGNINEYTIKEVPIEGWAPEIEIQKYPNQNGIGGTIYFSVENYKTENFTATKVWEGGPEEKPDVTLQLYKQEYSFSNPVAYGDPVVLKNGETAYTWKNILAKDEIFTVKEVNVPEDYTVTYSHDTFTITNTFTGELPGETVDIEGIKTWDDEDNKAGKRPDSVTVNLLENGTIISSKVITEDNNWKYSFKDLPKSNNDGEIVYTITEDEVDNYTMNIEGYNITNTYKETEIPVDPESPEETIDIKGTKTWDDEDNRAKKRPESITVSLLANGKQVESKVVTKDSGWKYSFKDLPVKENGKEIEYRLAEDKVKDYEASFDKTNVTNKYVGKVDPTNPLPKTGVVTLTGVTMVGVYLLALGGYNILKKKK